MPHCGRVEWDICWYDRIEEKYNLPWGLGVGAGDQQEIRGLANTRFTVLFCHIWSQRMIAIHEGICGPKEVKRVPTETQAVCVMCV